MSPLRLGYKSLWLQSWVLSCSLTLFPFLWNMHAWGSYVTSSTMEGPKEWKTEASCQTALCVCELRSQHSSPSQFFRDCSLKWTVWLQSHETPWERSTLLSCSWIPYPQKLWDDKCLLFLANKTKKLIWGQFFIQQYVTNTVVFGRDEGKRVGKFASRSKRKQSPEIWSFEGLENPTDSWSPVLGNMILKE